MSDNPKSASELVNAALTATPSAAAAERAANPVLTDGASDVAAQELVDLYFVLEEPAERDAVFDKLLDNPSPVVSEFLSSMMQSDEDEFMRASAAAELARRGDVAGLAALEQELREPTDAHLFAMAVEALIELRGAAVYDLVQAIWRNPSYDSAERLEAMLGMEQADTPRAMEDFLAFIEAAKDMESLPDDQLEAILAAFIRCGHSSATPTLEKLKARILANRDLDETEKKELAAMVQEGMELLEVT